MDFDVKSHLWAQIAFWAWAVFRQIQYLFFIIIILNLFQILNS